MLQMLPCNFLSILRRCRLLVEVEPIDCSVLGSALELGKLLTSLPLVPLSLGLNMHLPSRTG